MARKKDSGKPSVLSQEYVIDSDSDGLGEADATAQKDTSISNGECPLKRKEKMAQTASNLRTNNPAVHKSNGHETSSPTSHGSSDEEEEDRRASIQKMQKRQKILSPISNPAAVTVAATPFRPPHGFVEVKPDASDFAAEALEKLSGDLAGKQVWHITAPASVPLGSIREFNVDAVRNGHPILTHNQRQYGFSTSAVGSEGLLLPDGRGNTYKRLKTSKLQSYHLREIPQLPNARNSDNEQRRESIDFFAKEVPLSKPAPEQPKMLKMRYRPFGTDRFVSTSMSTDGDLAVEEHDFQAPPPLPSPRHESTAPPESTPRKKKKDKKKKERNSSRSEPNEEIGLENDSMQIDESPAPARIMQQSSSQTDPSMSETARVTGGVDEDMVISEKKRRKKKKKKIHDEQPS